ncbi:MAG: S-layer homology domain-containing protein [Oscillospiraceae bacterium]|nr:S-layer homology domain-containing protein [Oscillospiraceae bacterium]
MKTKHKVSSLIIGLVIFSILALSPHYPIVGGSNGKEVIAEYTFESPGWATFGIVLPMGKAYEGLIVGNLVTQNDVKNSWSDGSIRYAILTTYITNPGSYEIYENSVAAGTFTPILPSARLELNIEGTALYVSDLPNNVSGDLWLDGPLVKEWRVRDIPILNGIEHPFLSNIWDIRIYNDGTGTVDIAVENIRDVAEADGLVYGVDILVNGSVAYHHDMSRPGNNPISYYGGAFSTSFYSLDNELARGSYIRITSGDASGAVGCVIGFNNSVAPRGDHIIDVNGYILNNRNFENESWETVFYHQYGARWRKTIELGGFTSSRVITDFAPFIEANAIPEYMSNVYSTASLVGYGDWEGADPLGFSSVYVAMTSTGGRPELGPYPRWAARFMVHQTPELREQTMSLGDLAGSWAMHFAKNDPSQLVTLDEIPNYWLDSRAGSHDKPLNNLKGAINLFYNSHAPSYVYIPYLVTGDRYYSDEMMFRANHVILSTYPGYVEPGAILRNGDKGMLWNNQLRGIAWGLRDVVDAAYYLPDGAPYKEYFMKIVGNNLSGMDELVRNTHSPLGFVRMGNSFESNGDIRTAPWMGAYMVWSLQHAIEQRIDSNNPELGAVVRDSMIHYLFHPAIEETDFPPEYLPGYWIIVGKRVGSSGVIPEFFETWKELYESNWQNPDGTPIEIPNWGYGLDLRIALIAGKRAGYPDIDKAYDYFMSMLNDPSRNLMARLPEGSAYAFADYIPKPGNEPTQPEPTTAPPEPTPSEPSTTPSEPTPSDPTTTPSEPASPDPSHSQQEPDPTDSPNNGNNNNGGGTGISGGGGGGGVSIPTPTPSSSDDASDTEDSTGATEIDDGTVPGSDFTSKNPFADIKESDWFYNYVMYSYSQGLMIGTSTEPMLFSPNISTTRAMIVTVLYRIDSARIAKMEDEIKTEMSNSINSENDDGHNNTSNSYTTDLSNPMFFTDVTEIAWYYGAVMWAAECGIVEGYGNGRFGPTDNITRQDLAVIFNRYADYIGLELPTVTPYQNFADEADIADYAKNAVQNLYCAEIINGKLNNIFDPRSEATRAEFATMLTRFHEYLSQ